MATLNISVSDALLSAFEQKYPPEARRDALIGALIELVQDDPYSPEAYAEDERRYQESVRDDSFVPHEDVMAKLKHQLSEARARQDVQR